MPIKIPDLLPARSILESENIFVMTQYRAIHQDIRPLKMLILNLMPTKEVTEVQLLRKLSNTPLQIEIELLRTISHEAHNVSDEHLEAFYVSFDEIRSNRYDGMIITGAPVENLEYEDVDYWRELCEIMEWSKTNVYCTMHICWGALAALNYHYGIEKRTLDKKLFGVYPHIALNKDSRFFRGLDDVFYVPHSRFAYVDEDEVRSHDELEIMAISEQAGVFAVRRRDNRQFFITGHPEYDRNTLKQEYLRDVAKGSKITVPENYFPNDDPEREPLCTWRSCAQLMYTNWLNYFVYQTTPYEISKVGGE